MHVPNLRPILCMSLEDKRDNLFLSILFMSYDVIREIIYSPRDNEIPPSPPKKNAHSVNIILFMLYLKTSLLIKTVLETFCINSRPRRGLHS